MHVCNLDSVRNSRVLCKKLVIKYTTKLSEMQAQATTMKSFRKQTNHLSSIIGIFSLFVAAAVGGIVPLSFSNTTLNHK